MLNLPEILGNNQVGSVSDQDTGTDFTGRIQLIYGTSKVRTEWKGKGKKPEEGTFWFGPSNDSGKSLGEEFYAIVIDTRNHALKLKGYQSEYEAFQRPPTGKPPANKEQEIFMMIEQIARDNKANKAAGAANKAMFGSDVLFYVPDIGEVGIYFFHSTAAPEANNARANKGKFVKVGLQKPAPKSRDGIVYNSPVVEDVDPKDVEAKYKDHTIDSEKLKMEHTKFINPLPKTGEAQVTQTPDGRVR